MRRKKQKLADFQQQCSVHTYLSEETVWGSVQVGPQTDSEITPCSLRSEATTFSATPPHTQNN